MPIDQLGAIASMLALALSLAGYVYIFGKKYFRNKRETEKEIDEYLELYESSSRSVSARTDLGFYLNNMISHFQYSAILWQIFSALHFLSALILSLFAYHATERWLKVSVLVLALIFCIFTFRAVSHVMRNAYLVAKYSSKLHEIWEVHVSKRSQTPEKS